MNDFLERVRGRLIVSCQARVGWAMYGAEIMAAFARAAEEGGAAGIRANAPENVAAIRKATSLPIVGLNKIWDEAYGVYITPTFGSARAVIEAGASVVALDATGHSRPGGRTFGDIVGDIRARYPDVLVMADIATFEEGMEAVRSGADMVSTTLAGYTPETKGEDGVALGLIERLAGECGRPVVAEGHIGTKEEALECLRRGAWSVVVGTAITRPEIITRRFVDELAKFSEKETSAR